MKKTIPILSAIAIFGAIAITATAVYAVNGNFRVAVSDDGIAERDEIDKIAEVKLVSGKTIQVTYNKSRSVMEGFADIYKDEKGNDYIFKNGKPTGFYSNEIDYPNLNCEPVGEEAARKIAVEFLSQFTDNIGEYELQSFTEKENYGQYFFTFARKIGDVFTDENADVSVMYDGRVKSAGVYNDEKYADVPDEIVSGITEDALRSYAQSEMDIIYPEAEEEFEMDSYTLKSDSERYYISIYGAIDNRSESVRYDIED